MDDANPAPRTEIISCAVDAWQRGDTDAVLEVCARHPELAAEIHDATGALAALDEASSRSSDPTRIGRYEIRGRVGEGGMGVIYRARDPKLDRDVALKLLPAVYADAPEAVERFRREARALARINHTHIVSVHEVGETDEGLPYFAMPLVDGDSLRGLLQRLDPDDIGTSSNLDLRPGSRTTEQSGTAPGRRGSYVETVVRLVAKVADALHHAHQAGVVHRDVKPANILVDRHGEPHVVDFGIARARGMATLTRSGNEPGTPSYMAPEQLRAERAGIGPSTDVFALGVVLYEALSLRLPFVGETSQQVFHQILNHDPVPLRRLVPTVSRDLETICSKALEKSSTRRYSTAREFAEDLHNLLELRPILARPAGFWTRGVRLARRHPWPTAGLAFVLATLIAGLALQQQAAAERASERIRGLESYRQLQTSITEHEKRLAPLEHVMGEEAYMPASDVEELLQLRRLLKADQLAQRVLFLETSVDLILAQGDGTQLRTVCVDALLGEWRRALRQHDTEERNEIAKIIEKLQVDEEQQAMLEGWRRVQLTLSPREALVHLFRYAPHPGHEYRLAPHPCDANGALLPINDFLPGEVVLAVTSVAAGSPAADAGIRCGDLIAKINGLPIEGTVFALDPRTRTVGRLEELRWDSGRLDIRSEYGLEAAMRRLATTPSLDAIFRFGDLRHTVSPEQLTDPTPCVSAEVAVADATTLEVEVVSENVRVIPLTGPSGIVARKTAYPLRFSAANRLEPTAEGAIDLTLPPASYLFLVRHPGYQDLRLPCLVEHAELHPDRLEMTAAMIEDGTTPGEDLVHVPPGPCILGGDPDALVNEAEQRRARQTISLDAFWIGRSEVTIRQWIAFIDEVDEADESAARRLLPSNANRGGGVLWARKDKKYRPTDPDWRPDWPLGGISKSQATAYCEWRSKHAPEWEFALPTEEQWEKAARGADGRFFTWGNEFHPHYCQNYRARPRDAQAEGGRAEPALRFVRDESPFGIANMTGGALELCTRGDDPKPEWAPWRGGYFSNGAKPGAFRLASQNIGKSGRTGIHDGFRVVATRKR